jgi:molybdenum cofactor cytidylyltransferase
MYVLTIGEFMTAILLAAGLSRRMGGQDKLLLVHNGKPMLQSAIELLCSLPCSKKIIVTTAERLSAAALPAAVLPVINPSPQEGQSESLRLGLKAAEGEYYFFLNADQPRLTLACLSPLLDSAKKNPDKIIYPLVHGKPSSPVIFPACFREELMALTGDTGGRTIRNAYPQSCFPVEIKNPENFMDIDDIDNYKNLLRC